jgi:3-isopropylmalate/(R)-2-methylmalate dehydratase small subunit
MNGAMNFRSRLVPLPMNNVDTDQIIPARFLKTISKQGLDKQLFNDWRYDAQGNPKPDFILNQPRVKGAQILLAGDNFGCGSSREHAPWALTQFGFRAVISTSFADIFKQNSLKNALLPIVFPTDAHAALFAMVDAIRTPKSRWTWPRKPWPCRTAARWNSPSIHSQGTVCWRAWTNWATS